MTHQHQDTGPQEMQTAAAMRQDYINLTPEQASEIQAMFARYAFQPYTYQPEPTPRQIISALAITLITSTLATVALWWITS